jgi:hypothetical protein
MPATGIRRARLHAPIIAVMALCAAAGVPAAAAMTEFDRTAAERFAQLALRCVHQEYPNKIGHVLNSDADVAPPRRLTPAFYGCFDWHSSVHGHWLLARFARLHPGSPLAAKARAALAQSLSKDRLRAEVDYLSGKGRVSFERPYGLAWLLQLGAELREWDDAQAAQWSTALAPLEALAAERLSDWLPKLTYPIRSGEHSQTAFALGLALDWARTAGDTRLESLLVERLQTYYLGDRECPLAYEPSGHDFLSPCIAEADAMRRVLEPARFSSWLAAFLPVIPARGDAGWLPPAVVTDPGDPKLAHLDGLNLSRAWMLEGIASALPGDDPRRAAVAAAARAHRDAGVAAVTGEHYEGGHWLGSFAMYLVSGRGLRADG